MELVSRMMDGSISYDPKARLEPVLSGATVKEGDKIERLKEVRIFEECSQRQLRSVLRRDESAGWRPSLSHNRRGDTGPPSRDQSPELLCASQGRARAQPIPLDDALTARPAGRRECGTYGGRIGWVMRRGRHPTYARGQQKALTLGLAREKEHWQTQQGPVSLSPRL